jgi:hypothetical protein
MKVHPRKKISLNNLPVPISTFVGRERELAEVRHLLSGYRLVTLTGTGGSGKTRLVLQVAVEVIDSFDHGAWWVELASLSDKALVLHAIAKADLSLWRGPLWLAVCSIDDH